MIPISFQRHIPAILVSVLLVLSVILIRPFLLALFFGAVAAAVLYPVYTFLLRRVRRKSLAAFLVCLLVLILLVVPSVFFVKGVVLESYALFIMVKQRLAIGLFRNCSNTFCEAVRNYGQDPNVQYHVQEISRTATNWIIQRGSKFLVSVPKLLLNLFVIFFTLFYFLRDGDVLLQKIGSYLNLRREKYQHLLRRLREIVQGVVYGYLLIAVIQGALGALGFFLFGLPSPLFWGMTMGFFALIPTLGTGIIWVPAAILLFLNGIFQDSTGLLVKGIGLFLYGLLLIGSIDNFLRPKLMGNKAKIHPAVILIGILGGAFVLGPAGVLVGPLILSLTLVVIELYRGEAYQKKAA